MVQLLSGSYAGQQCVIHQHGLLLQHIVRSTAQPPALGVAVMLTQLLCCMLQADNNADDDWLDYNNELRIGILEAYSGILQGLGPGETAGV